MAKVIFKKNIRGVAQIGDVKNVADGYARNFLLPQKLAILVTPETLKQVEVLKQQKADLAEKEKTAIQDLTKRLTEFVLVIERAANEEGTLYDGLDSVELSHYLKKNGFNLEPEQIQPKEKYLKRLGSYVVTLDLGQQTEADLKVEIKKQEE